MPGFSPPTQKADLAGMFIGGTQQQSREMEGEKGFWPIANSCVFFSASSNRRPSDGGAIPLEKVYRGSHSASHPPSLAPISHPLPSNYCSFHLTSATPKTLSLSSFIAPLPDKLAPPTLFPMTGVCAPFRKAAHTFRTVGAISMTPCAVRTRKNCKFTT